MLNKTPRCLIYTWGWNFFEGRAILRQLEALSMKMRSCFVSALAALAGLIITGCVIHEPVYTAPPPVAVVNGTPAPAPVPAAAAIPEPAPGTAVVASQPPPVAPQVETPPPQPGPDYVWAPGYWNWSGVAWVWAPGVWIVPPYRGAVWFGGHWGYRGGRAYWVRGRWR